MNGSGWKSRAGSRCPPVKILHSPHPARDFKIAPLRDRQRKGCAGAAAAAANIARVSARGLDGDALCSRPRDERGRQRNLQLGAVKDLSSKSRPVELHHRGRPEIAAGNREKKSILDLRVGDAGGRKRSNGRARPRTSTQGIE